MWDLQLHKHLRQIQNDRHCTDNTAKCIFLTEKFYIFVKHSRDFHPSGTIENKVVPNHFLNQWWLTSVSPCGVTRPQWIKIQCEVDCQSFWNLTEGSAAWCRVVCQIWKPLKFPNLILGLQDLASYCVPIRYHIRHKIARSR